MGTINSIQPESTQETFLKKSNYLSEYSTEKEKELVRVNLGVASKDTVISSEEVNNLLSSLKDTISKTYDATIKDLQSSLSRIESNSKNYVRTDGSIPFTKVQAMVGTPSSASHITNKSYVDDLVNKELTKAKAGIVDSILSEVESTYLSQKKASSQYVVERDVLDMLNAFIKQDGSRSFTAAVSGVFPTLPSHLVTKQYVDTIIETHKKEIDPHGYTETCLKLLQNYCKRSDVYDKSETLSRVDIVEYIDSIIAQFKDSLREYVNLQINTAGNDIIKTISDEKFVKANGSTPFTQPQVGVPATKNNELVTLAQLRDNADTWHTTGPVQTTVGFVTDNSNLPSAMSLQDVMDAIFYPRKQTMVVTKTLDYGNDIIIDLSVHSRSTLETVTIYVNDELYRKLTLDDFIVGKTGEVTYSTSYTPEQTGTYIFKAIFTYTDYEAIEVAAATVSAPTFIGIMPFYKLTAINSLDIFKETALYYNQIPSTYLVTNRSIYSKLYYTSPAAGYICLLIPAQYNVLQMNTSNQSFSVDNFNVQEIQVLVGKQTEPYKVYIFKEAQYIISDIITFTLE